MAGINIGKSSSAQVLMESESEKLSLHDLEKALMNVDCRRALVATTTSSSSSSVPVPMEASVGYYVVTRLPRTWEVIQAASNTCGFPKDFIEAFAKNGLHDGLIPYTSTQLRFLTGQFRATFLHFQNLYLAVQFAPKQYRALQPRDAVPFVRAPRDRHCERKGSFGVVYKVREGDLIYACKEMRITDFAERERQLLTEIIPEANHLLKLRASYLQNGKLHLILHPWVEWDLEQFTTNRDGFGWWTEMKKDGTAALTIAGWMCCLAATLATLHSFKVKHMDLKPDNIGLALENDKFVPYLLDYGCSKFFRGDSKGIDSSGSVYYASPEKRKGEFEGRKGDIFSLGIVTYELACVLAPGSRKSFKKLMHGKGKPENWWGYIASHKMHEEVLRLLPRDDSSCFWDALASLLRKMLDIQPEKRPNAREVWEELKAIHESMQWDIHCMEKLKTPSPTKLPTHKEEAVDNAGEDEDDDDDPLSAKSEERLI